MKSQFNFLIKLRPTFLLKIILKVSKSRKQLIVSSILPKNEQKQFDLRYHSTKADTFRLFFGRIEETMIPF